MRTIPETASQCFTVEDTLVIPIVIDEDERIHTDEHPRCNDATCPCQCEQVEEETLIVNYPQG